MVKSFNGDLLLLFKTKKSYVHQHLLYRFLLRTKENGVKENQHTPEMCVASADK